MAGGVQVRQAQDVKAIEAGLIQSRRIFGPSQGSKCFSFYHATIAPGYADTSGYEYDEIVYLLKGQAEIEIDGARRTVGPGSAIFVPEGGVATWKVVGAEANEVLVVRPAGR